MDDAKNILNELQQVKASAGYVGVGIVIAFAVLLYLLWTYIKRGIERAAEVNAEKNLKSFQSLIDKELVKFSANHQKQIDAVHECYTRFQRLTYMIDFIQKPDKFYNAPKPREQVKMLIQFRHDFKQIYLEHRIVLPLAVCGHIDKLLPAVDDFIQIFDDGLFDLNDEKIALNSDANGGVYLAGIWSPTAFDDVLRDLKDIGDQIEAAFRIINGTNN